MLGHFFLPFNIRKEKIIQKRTILKRIIAAVLFIAVAFVDMTATNAATARRVVQPQTTTTTNRTITPRTTTARTTTKRTTTKNTSTAKTTTTTAQRVANRTVPTTKASTEQSKTNVVSRTATNKNAGATRRYTQSSTQSRTITRATTLTGTVGAKSGADDGLVKMYVPDDLRLSDENIKKYVELSSSGDGNNYILFKLYNNQLPSLATMFNRIKVQHNDNTYGVYAENSTTSNTIVNTSGTQTATSVPASMYLVQSQSTTGGACTQNSDCGAGTCNGNTHTCTCNSNATPSGDTCKCNIGFKLSGNTCVENIISNGCDRETDCGAGICDENARACKCDPNATPSGDTCVCNSGFTQSGFPCVATTTNITCTQDSDCGAGTCNTSNGTCQCFLNHTTKTGNVCACETGYTLSGGKCVKQVEADSTSIITCTGANNEIIVSGNNCVKSKFEITTLNTVPFTDADSVGFRLTAIGTFYVDWGDGTVEQIVSNSLDSTDYIHKYVGKKSRRIRFGGVATGGYSDTKSPIEFGFIHLATKYVEHVYGSLGELFPIRPGATNPVPRFIETFQYCKQLKTIPSTLFSGLNATAPSMFEKTFEWCTQLTNIPSGLFSDITGAPQKNLFNGTFNNCNKVASIPSGLFSGIQGAPAENMFANTFRNCYEVTSIPNGLFSGISGAPVKQMFYSTFDGCSKLSYIPNDLFSGIQGAPATAMFDRTFAVCSELTSIPEDLFAGISGAPAPSMFWGTFSSCAKIQSLPAGLFRGIRGPTAWMMYYNTFSGCKGLTGNIPDDFFGKLYGVPSSYMFQGTFSNCNNLTGTVPSSMYKNLQQFEVTPGNPGPTNTYSQAFSGCTNMATSCENGTYEDPASAPFKSEWNGHVACTDGTNPNAPTCPEGQFAADDMCITPKFAVTTTSDTRRFAFTMSFEGLLFVDWGDGTVQILAKNTDTKKMLVSHNYTTAGEHTIRFGASPTNYSVYPYPSPIRFGYGESDDDTQEETATNVKSISGSLAELFPQLDNATNKLSFGGTFNGCSNLESIPAGLFSGLTGTSPYLFQGTFKNCTKLTSIPSTLFAGISGAPTKYLFSSTFAGCTGITSIPETLFSTITGELSEGLFAGTFKGCSGLTGQIPNNLFSSLSGPDNRSFQNMFKDCTGLSGYVPTSFYINKDLYAGSSSSSVFENTGLATECASPLVLDPRAPKNYNGNPYWDYKVACNYPCTSDKIDAHKDGLECYDPEFEIVTTDDTTELKFVLTATGTFYVDCGDDGTLSRRNTGSGASVTGNTITQQTSVVSVYTCSYPTAGRHTIRMAGEATGYTDNDSVGLTREEPAAITFYNADLATTNQNVAEIRGSLAAMFPEVGSRSGITECPRFHGTFRNTQIKTIPEGLFDGLSGCGQYTFYYTFANNEQLESIPGGLFSSITTGVKNMFDSTFRGCTKLTSIPSNLFSNLHSVDQRIFESTFAGCTGLTALPVGLFQNITTAAPYMFWNTFNGCSNMGRYIPSTAFKGLTDNNCPTESNMWTGTFNNTSMSTMFCPQGTTKYTSCYSGGGFGDWVACEEGGSTGGNEDPQLFTCTGATDEIVVSGTQCVKAALVVTTKEQNSFKFDISAGGTFYVDWGDGNVETIDRSGTTSLNTVSHNYTTAAKRTVRFGGVANAYSTTQTHPAIRFYSGDGCDIYGIDQSSSLGAMFPIIASGGNGNTPRFYETFRSCIDKNNTSAGTNGTALIPAGLFSGINGAPVSYMFYDTFAGSNFRDPSSGPTIPSGLFSGITGAPAEHLFDGTFRNIEYMSGNIPADLFAGIQGTPAPYMFARTFAYAGGAWENRDFRIDSALFGFIAGTPAKGMFESTFEGSWLTNLPIGLFANISGAPAIDMFDSTFKECTHVSGATLSNTTFGNISGTVATGMFKNTFKNITGITGSIPNKLFGTLTGAPAQDMFAGTFEGCTGITGAIPSGLFGSISGNIQWPMAFNSTFYNTSITSIPEDLFSGITGTDFEHSFTYTFAGTKITSIPENLFAGITGTYESMFTGTFMNCENLTTVPAGLFNRITGTPKPLMFDETFAGCTSLQQVPYNLFGGISGAPVNKIFPATFKDSGLTSIDNRLFSGITGAPATNIFYETFSGCTGLTALPTELFKNISGTPADSMFHSTFEDCSNITGNIPNDLFGPVSGNPAAGMFAWTFIRCSSLTGEVPTNMFVGLNHDYTMPENTSPFTNAFYKTGMPAQCPEGYKLHPYAAKYRTYWDGRVACVEDETGGGDSGGGETTNECTTNSDCGAGTCDSGTCNCDTNAQKDANGVCQCESGFEQSGTTCVEIPVTPTCTDKQFLVDNKCIDSKFEITTTSDTDIFKFAISANGTFYVDWGDGSTPETITRNSTYQQTVSHTYQNSGSYTIRFGGTVTGYNGVAAIMFGDNGNNNLTPTKLKNISGSLAELFPIVGNGGEGNTPMFLETFKGCSNLQSIPSGLFDFGKSVQPIVLMFAETFMNCTGLRGEIPNDLFASISGEASIGLFNSTFYNCSGLTGYVPTSIYNGLTSTNNNYSAFYDTFTGTNLSTTCPTGKIPDPATIIYADYWDGHVACIEGEAPTPTCPDDCGAGTCDTSTGTCQCFTNATTTNGVCQCSDGFELNGDTCKACTVEQFFADGQCIDSKFEIETIDSPDTFSFSISAKGTFYVDWGDGSTPEKISRAQLNNLQEITHRYSGTDSRKIRIGGTTTGYSIYSYKTIGFSTYPNKLKSISGSLAELFPVVGNGGEGNTPMFWGTFENCTNLTYIPYGLFAFPTPVQPVTHMFDSTFKGCTNLGSFIPNSLFASISGTPAQYMFESTFEDCSHLVGTIPDDLFGDIDGAPASGMFNSTFKGCSGLWGEIPSGLFGNLTGAPAPDIFKETFYNCSGLSSSGYVPSSMYKNLEFNNSTPTGMFLRTFYNSGLATACGTGYKKDPDAEPYEQYWDGHVACVAQ